MRINRYLARAGVASRRKAEELIRAGRVMVNGAVVDDFSIDITDQTVFVDGERITPPQKRILLRFHKPKGVLSSRFDPHGGPYIFDYLPKDPSLIAIGRLDKASEGLMLITNDGVFAQQMAHPSHETKKEYIVLLDRPLQSKDRARIAAGTRSFGAYYHVDRLLPYQTDARLDAILEHWPPRQASGRIWHVALHEGKKREIRRLFQAHGYEVERLIRIKMGGYSLYGLSPGKVEEIAEQYRNARG